MSNLEPTTFTSSILSKMGSWLPRGWVWRRSPLGPLQTLLTVIQMTAFGNTGYRAALRVVFEDMHKAFGWSKGVPTPSALTQARGKLSEKMCLDLFKRIARESTHVSSHTRLRYRDFSRVVAVDGTKLTLQSTAALKRDFGCPAGDHLAPQALLSLLWDVGGNVPIDWRLGPFNGSEHADLDDMLGALQSGDLLLADRFYPSRASFAGLQERGIHFIMRIKTKGRNLMRETQTFLSSGSDDLTIPMHDHPGQQLRFIRHSNPDGDDMIVITSLSADTHCAQAILELYQRRWSIETAYRSAKEWHGLDALPGKSTAMVRQEVCAFMLFWLMQGELEGQARRVYADEIRKQPEVDPEWTPAAGISELPVQFNRRLAATALSLLMVSAVTSLDKAVESWRVSMRYLWQNRMRRKPGRSFRRTSQRPHEFKKRDDISKAEGLKRQTKKR